MAAFGWANMFGVAKPTQFSKVFFFAFGETFNCKTSSSRVIFSLSRTNSNTSKESFGISSWIIPWVRARQYLPHKSNLKRQSDLFPSHPNVETSFQLIVNKCQTIAQLVDKAQTLENGSQNLIAHVRLPTQHVIIIDRRGQQANRRPSAIFCKSSNVIVCLSNDLQKSNSFQSNPIFCFKIILRFLSLPPKTAPALAFWDGALLKSLFKHFHFVPKFCQQFAIVWEKLRASICIRGVSFVIRHECRGKIRQCVNLAFK